MSQQPGAKKMHYFIARNVQWWLRYTPWKLDNPAVYHHQQRKLGGAVQKPSCPVNLKLTAEAHLQLSQTPSGWFCPQHVESTASKKLEVHRSERAVLTHVAQVHGL